jgi:hypothetical protein
MRNAVYIEPGSVGQADIIIRSVSTDLVSVVKQST